MIFHFLCQAFEIIKTKKKEWKWKTGLIYKHLLTRRHSPVHTFSQSHRCAYPKTKTALLSHKCLYNRRHWDDLLTKMIVYFSQKPVVVFEQESSFTYLTQQRIQSYCCDIKRNQLLNLSMTRQKTLLKYIHEGGSITPHPDTEVLPEFCFFKMLDLWDYYSFLN